MIYFFWQLSTGMHKHSGSSIRLRSSSHKKLISSDSNISSGILTSVINKNKPTAYISSSLKDLKKTKSGYDYFTFLDQHRVK